MAGGVLMLADDLQNIVTTVLLEEADTALDKSLPNRNSLGNKIVPDDDPEKLKNFWAWFNGSKAVDLWNNTPKVFYHGTQIKRKGKPQPEFSSFDRSKLGINSHFSSKVGFFFTPKSSTASNFGQRVMPVYLKMVNPKIYTRGKIDDRLETEFYKANKDKDEYGAQKLMRDVQAHKDSYDLFVADIYHRNGEIPYWGSIQGNFYDAWNLKDRADGFIRNYVNSLKSEGFDSIIIQDTIADASKNFGEKTTQYCVFDPEQIKSVNNLGSFSSSNPNIYEQEIPEIADADAFLNDIKPLI